MHFLQPQFMQTEESHSNISWIQCNNKLYNPSPSATQQQQTWR